MKNRARNISLLALAAGIVVVPLIRYFWQRRYAMAEEKTGGYNPSPEVTKGLFSAYRGSHLPHRRKSGPTNGFPLH